MVADTKQKLDPSIRIHLALRQEKNGEAIKIPTENGGIFLENAIAKVKNSKVVNHTVGLENAKRSRRKK